MTELQLAAMRQARETLLIAAANFGGLAPAMRDRCIRDANALHEVYIGQAAAQPAVPQPAEDAELLDWLEAHLFERKWSGTIGQPSGWYMAGPYRHTMQHMRGESLRAAIRAAIKAQGGKQ